MLLIHNVLFLNSQVSQVKNKSQVEEAQLVLAYSIASLCQTLECCKEKGNSSWLSAIPIEQHAFVLHKANFIDALCLCYG